MFIYVQELRERGEPLVLDQSIRPEALPFKDQLCRLQTPVRLSGFAELLSSRGVRIRGALGADVNLVCSRCLKEFGQKVEKPLDLAYMPNQDGEDEVELSYGDLEVGLFSQARIDLNSVIIEQIVLEIPMKPVCSAACRGLCDQCGVDLNISTCNCARTSDPRWTGLAALRDRLNK